MAIDAVLGATISSNAFMAALADYVGQAGGDVAVLKGRKIENSPA
jgi:hypothetical protein